MYNLLVAFALHITEFFGYLSAFLVTISSIPYMYRAWQKKITPVTVSWFLWTLISFSILLTYDSSGAKDNIWPALFAFVNCAITLAIVLYRKNNFGKAIVMIKQDIININPFSFVTKTTKHLWLGFWTMEKSDRYCLIFGLISLISWIYLESNQNLVQYSLYIGLLADAFAAIATITFTWKNPMEERPFAWLFFSFGYGLGIFAITEHTIANYSLPVYMCLGSATISLPLVIRRIKNKTPLKEWI